MWFHHIVSLCLLSLDGSCQDSFDILCRGSYEELVFTRGHHPCRCSLVERGQVGSFHGERESLTLTRLQTLCLGIGLQLLGGLIGCLVVRSGDIKFHNFLALKSASILYGDCHVINVVLLGNLRIAILESGLTEAKAERITDGHIERVEVTVADVDILLVIGIIDVLLVTFLTLVQHVDLRVLVDGEITG